MRASVQVGVKEKGLIAVYRDGADVGAAVEEGERACGGWLVEGRSQIDCEIEEHAVDGKRVGCGQSELWDRGLAKKCEATGGIGGDDVEAAIVVEIGEGGGFGEVDGGKKGGVFIAVGVIWSLIDT